MVEVAAASGGQRGREGGGERREAGGISHGTVFSRSRRSVKLIWQKGAGCLGRFAGQETSVQADRSPDCSITNFLTFGPALT